VNLALTPSLGEMQKSMSSMVFETTAQRCSWQYDHGVKLCGADLTTARGLFGEDKFYQFAEDILTRAFRKCSGLSISSANYPSAMIKRMALKKSDATVKPHHDVMKKFTLRLILALAAEVDCAHPWTLQRIPEEGGGAMVRLRPMVCGAMVLDVSANRAFVHGVGLSMSPGERTVYAFDLDLVEQSVEVAKKALEDALVEKGGEVVGIHFS
jgi:hypothetical protein